MCVVSIHGVNCFLKLAATLICTCGFEFRTFYSIIRGIVFVFFFHTCIRQSTVPLSIDLVVKIYLSNFISKSEESQTIKEHIDICGVYYLVSYNCIARISFKCYISVVVI